MTYKGRYYYARIANALATIARQSKFRSVLFTSSDAGEGTTTTALHVGRALQSTFGLKTLLVEYGFRRVSLEGLLELKADSFLTDIAPDPTSSQRTDSYEETGQAVPTLDTHEVSGPVPSWRTIPQDETGLTILPAGAKEVSVGSLKRALTALESKFDMVLVDAPALRFRSDAIRAGTLVPRVVLVVQAARTRWESLHNLKSDLENQNIAVIGSILDRQKRYIPQWIYRWVVE